jgi:hypothetical protein
MSGEEPLDFSDADVQPIELNLQTTPYNPDPGRDRTRARLAYLLTSTVLVIVLAALMLLVTGSLKTSDLESVSAALLTPVIGLVGTVLGFYFGQQRSGN